jgi:hypothetical protein
MVHIDTGVGTAFAFAKTASSGWRASTAKRHKGKPQLTADESVRFWAKALELANQALAGGHTGRRMNNMNQLEGSIAAACCLWLGPRASEVSDRVVRDLDCRGSVLIIPDPRRTRAFVAWTCRSNFSLTYGCWQKDGRTTTSYWARSQTGVPSTDGFAGSASWRTFPWFHPMDSEEPTVRWHAKVEARSRP